MILFALALMASSLSDAAAPSAPTPAANTTATAPAAAPPADDLDKVVCHVDTETGTRLGSHKECHTKREWVQMQSEQSNYLDQQTALSHPH
jgi:hypothetical protein